jgi:hypothetical protein
MEGSWSAPHSTARPSRTTRLRETNVINLSTSGESQPLDLPVKPVLANELDRTSLLSLSKCFDFCADLSFQGRCLSRTTHEVGCGQPEPEPTVLYMHTCRKI